MSTPATAKTPVDRAPDGAWSYATKPTAFTVFLRTFLPWQMWRFVRINLKMITIINRSHHPH